mmetsp:Transcript_15356/g.39558  ORF Transcript_15356/g.39558 Transcript_15356/m.39558 type:complete len:283 (+) Transcript_15356:577-1425(+)
MHQPQTNDVPTSPAHLGTNVEHLTPLQSQLLGFARPHQFLQVTIAHKLEDSEPRRLLHSDPHELEHVVVFKVKHDLGLADKLISVGCRCPSLEQFDRSLHLHDGAVSLLHGLQPLPHLTKLSGSNHRHRLDVGPVDLLGKELGRRSNTLALCCKGIVRLDLLLVEDGFGLVDVEKDGFGEKVAVTFEYIHNVALHLAELRVFCDESKLVKHPLPPGGFVCKWDGANEEAVYLLPSGPLHDPNVAWSEHDCHGIFVHDDGSVWERLLQHFVPLASLGFGHRRL